MFTHSMIFATFQGGRVLFSVFFRTGGVVVSQVHQFLDSPWRLYSRLSACVWCWCSPVIHPPPTPHPPHPHTPTHPHTPPHQSPPMGFTLWGKTSKPKPQYFEALTARTFKMPMTREVKTLICGSSINIIYRRLNVSMLHGTLLYRSFMSNP